MASLKRQVRRLVENTCGVDIEWIEARSYVISGRAVAGGVWCAKGIRLAKLLERLGIDLVIDVGANMGQFVRELRRHYAGEVISFEPVDACFSQLEEAAKDDVNWSLQPLALGSRAGVDTIHVSSLTNFSSILETSEYCAHHFGEGSTGSYTQSIQVVRLDEILKSLVDDIGKHRIFLKMDTQGYDLEVFKGAEGILEHIWLLQSEVSLIPLYDDMPHWLESIACYEKAGFHVAGLFPVNEDDGAVIEYDCLMKR